MKSAVLNPLGMADGWNWLAGLTGPASAPDSQFRAAEQAASSFVFSWSALRLLGSRRAATTSAAAGRATSSSSVVAALQPLLCAVVCDFSTGLDRNRKRETVCWALSRLLELGISI